eukprot:scaffold101432_cov33-Tisochrysis_lutea.AAC.3
MSAELCAVSSAHEGIRWGGRANRTSTEQLCVGRTFSQPVQEAAQQASQLRLQASELTCLQDCASTSSASEASRCSVELDPTPGADMAPFPTPRLSPAPRRLVVLPRARWDGSSCNDLAIDLARNSCSEAIPVSARAVCTASTELAPEVTPRNCKRLTTAPGSSCRDARTAWPSASMDCLPAGHEVPPGRAKLSAETTPRAPVRA